MGSDFRIELDPAKLPGSAVARSTQPFGVVVLPEPLFRLFTNFGTWQLLLSYRRAVHED